jgi:hypothetical protein
MNRFDTLIAKWNFRKIAIVLFVALLVAAIGGAAAVGIVFRDKISFAWQYAKVGEAAEHSDAQALQTEIDKLAANSADVVDILILDSENNVTYSAKNSEFGSGQLNLARTGKDGDYLVDQAHSNAVFRFAKGDEYLLSSVFQHDFGRIHDEYDESFFEQASSDQTVYMLGFLGNRETGSKVYTISMPSSVAGGELTLTLVATAAMLMFMLYWVLVALWAYQSARKAKLYPLFWGLVVLVTNVAGVAVYLLYKRGNATCMSCGMSQSRDHRYCANCGAMIGTPCKQCGGRVAKRDHYCPNCGTKVE